MQTEILSAFKQTMASLQQSLALLNDENINIVPPEGGWSAGQDVEHILKAGFGLVKVMNGSVTTTERDPAQNVNQIKKIFLDFNTKMKSPEFIAPSNDAHQQKKLSDSLVKLSTAYEQAISLNLSETCKDHELPGMGLLTRLEWAWFVIYHTQRHTEQLERIHANLVAGGVQSNTR